MEKMYCKLATLHFSFSSTLTTLEAITPLLNVPLPPSSPSSPSLVSNYTLEIDLWGEGGKEGRREGGKR